MVLVAAGALLTWTLITLPYDQGTGKAAHARFGGSAEDAFNRQLPEIQQFARVWDLNLRRPLYDPPPPPPPKIEKPKPPPINFRLAGIVLNGDNSQVMVLQQDGSIVMLSVGDAIGSTKILSIHEDRIEVDHFGETQTLQMEGM